MKVYSAIMLDADEIANHNGPTLYVSASEAILLNMVRDHVKTHKEVWLARLNVNAAEVDTMGIDEMNEALSEYNEDDDNMGMELFIHTEEHEV